MAGPVLFTDNFDAETPGAGAVPSNWSVLNGTVDILGSGPNGAADDVLPGNGYYVDLDGNGTPGYLVTRQAFLLEAGVDYRLTFDLAGNNDDGSDQDTVWAGLLEIPSSAMPCVVYRDDPFSTHSLDFTGDGGSYHFVFCNVDGGDGKGPKLDNVMLTDVTPSIPAPGAMLLCGLGTSLVGWWHRCRSVDTSME